MRQLREENPNFIKILNFLKNNPKKSFQVSTIADELKMNYTTALNWIMFLVASKKVSMEFTGYIKLFKYQECGVDGNGL